MTRKELVELIAQRDGISFEEAFQCVEDCAEQLSELFDEDYNESPYTLYETATDIMRNTLGLEPDYLDILLEP